MNERYWFPAKPSGLGWGPPRNWQGWTFLVGWIALVTVGARSLAFNRLAAFFFVTGMIAVILLVGYFKGEPLGGGWANKK
jgi:hypothetical protein